MQHLVMKDVEMTSMKDELKPSFGNIRARPEDL